MKIDRKAFFDGWRQEFGGLNQSQVDGLTMTLDEFEKNPYILADPDLDDRREYMAYILATFKHETANTMRAILEYGGTRRAEKKYGMHTTVGQRLGNTKPGDGARYMGRGHVQLTGKRNYAAMGLRHGLDLVNDPDLMLVDRISLAVSIDGMMNGIYTGKSLKEYLNDSNKNYLFARRVVNGIDRYDTIARYARQIEPHIIF